MPGLRRPATGRGRRAGGVCAAILAGSVAGCAVGPDFKKVPAPQVKGYTPGPLASSVATPGVADGQAQVFVKGLDIPGQWWVLFHSPALNALIEDGLANNHDLQSAQAALRVAKENVKAQLGYFYPSAGAGLEGSRNKTSADLSPFTASGALYYSLYTAQLNISYSPDVWGLNLRTTESLQAEADMQRFQLEATYLTLTSNLVAAAVQEASLRGQIAATRRIIEIETEITDVFRKEKAFGQVGNADVAVQEAALAQAQSSLPILEKQLSQQRDLLTALTGHLPSEELKVRTFELSSLHLPTRLPVSLPSTLVEQRPDVRAAEENLHAAGADIGVAIANRLPNVALTANPGTNALTFDRIFSPGNNFYSIGGSLAQPLFDGGTLLHKQRSAEAAFDQARESYKSTVITAFQNVADSLRAIQHDADGLKTYAAAATAAQKSLDYTRGQLKLGVASNATLLLAEQNYQQAVINLVQAQAARVADTAALFQALGGGWWNRVDVAASPDVTRYGAFKVIDRVIPQVVP